MSAIIDLIQYRSFGDKLNELTSYLYDHFSTFWQYACWYLIGAAVILTSMSEIGFAEGSIYVIMSHYLFFFLMVLLVLLFAVFLRKVCVEGQVFDSSLHFLRESMADLGNALIVSLVPMILLVLAGDYFITHLVKIGNEYYFTIFFFVGLIFLTMPFFMFFIVTVFEQKSGFETLRRTFSLLTVSIIPSVIYFLILIIVGLVILALSEIPDLLFSLVLHISLDQFSNDESMEFIYNGYNYFRSALFLLLMLLYFFMLTLGTLLHYGHAVEVRDNVRFLTKLRNFDNL